MLYNGLSFTHSFTYTLRTNSQTINVNCQVLTGAYEYIFIFSCKISLPSFVLLLSPISYPFKIFICQMDVKFLLIQCACCSSLQFGKSSLHSLSTSNLMSNHAVQWGIQLSHETVLVVFEVLDSLTHHALTWKIVEKCELQSCRSISQNWNFLPFILLRIAMHSITSPSSPFRLWWNQWATAANWPSKNPKEINLFCS